jgi:hypothetical protein
LFMKFNASCFESIADVLCKVTPHLNLQYPNINLGVCFYILD